MARRGLAALLLLLLTVAVTRPAAALTTFKTGSLIIPMDTTYQDSGMLRAFGLLYALLKADVPVHWVIKSPKSLGDADFTTTAKDFKSSAVLPSHGYRGGPFVVDLPDVAKASPVITAWQTANPTPAVAVHITQQDFQGRTGRYLTAAPTIAIITDGAQNIAMGYLNAAKIPDRLGAAWGNSSPDLLTIAGIEGPTQTNHCDGSLFRPSGQPNYCQIMTMHWDTKQVWGVHDEAVAEYRCFLGFPVHMFAECQAVNAVENDTYGNFITTAGFVIDNNVADNGPFAFLNMDTPFAQMDGGFKLVNGSEQAYSLAPGSLYYDQNVVMIKDASTAIGTRSIWMTGYLKGQCSIGEGGDVGGAIICGAGVGKVSYLGGHSYSTSLPISGHPDTQGTRLFLNSLFEAGCVTSEGQPVIALSKSGPAWTTTGTVTYTLSWSNTGPGPALDFVVTDTLPAGASYVSSTGGATVTGSTVTWKVGDLGGKSAGSATVIVSFASYGSYTNSFGATFTVGLNSKKATSNAVTTVYQATPPTPDAGPLVDATVAADAKAADSATAADVAKSTDLSKPPDATVAVDLKGATEAAILADATKPGDATTGDASKLADATKPGDAAKGDASKPADHARPGDAKQPVDGAKADVPGGSELGGTEDRGGAAGLEARGPGGAAPGGCSCETTAAGGPVPLPLLLLGLVLALAARRRRR
jgi:uncharacterized repeat protein (TIGR01451 family)/MYXO-CTERM domain-containing protein